MTDISIDIFKNNAFSMASLTGEVNKMDYVPNYLDTVGIFDGKPVRTKTVYIDRKEHSVALIPDSATGAPPVQGDKAQRDAVSLQTRRLVKSRKLYAHELQDVRAFGLPGDLENVQAKIAELLGYCLEDLQLTFEHHRLGAVQGRLIDADGSSVIYNYFDEMGEAEEASFNMGLGTDTTNVLAKCKEIQRSIIRSGKGALGPNSRIEVPTGDSAWDQLTGHKNVEKFYLNSLNGLKAAENQKAFSYFDMPGTNMRFVNYRGTEDNSTVAIPDNEFRFFPVGGREVFKHAMGPHETFEGVNKPGYELYAEVEFEKPGNPGGSTYVDVKVSAYPLFMCQQPRLLRRAVAS